MIAPQEKDKVPNDLLWAELVELGTTHEVQVLGREAGAYGILLKGVPVPTEFQIEGRAADAPHAIDVLLRLSEAYPHAAPDMFWVSPAVALPTGARPAAADVTESYFGRTWQRFSWHLTPQFWRPLADTLAGTYVPFVEHRLHQVR